MFVSTVVDWTTNSNDRVEPTPINNKDLRTQEDNKGT